MKGYTLIEILVSLTIVGLLFSFGYISFRDYSRRQTVAGVVKEIQGDLRLAQEDALAGQLPSSTDDPKGFCSGTNSLNGYYFDIISTSEYDLEAVCTGGTVSTIFGENPAKQVTMPSDVLISATDNPILFKILGQGTNIPNGQNAEIDLSQVGTTNKGVVLVGSGGEIH
ncbi:MAG: prepilin-type N-terminal cleavage/methylation domain-containing protein [Candidatus Microgenomates bacterium]|jgi:prepilin-type N-terminal cleavage/methylation domain-containing protein